MNANYGDTRNTYADGGCDVPKQPSLLERAQSINSRTAGILEILDGASPKVALASEPVGELEQSIREIHGFLSGAEENLGIIGKRLEEMRRQIR